MVTEVNNQTEDAASKDIKQPSEVDQPSASENIVSRNEEPPPLDEIQPEMAADTSDEVPEVTDSLGLLAESSRVMEDDEEQETSEHDDGDDEEDFDPDDESSNQMTAEHSEDSNAQTSESDIPKDKPADIQTDMQTALQSEADNAEDFVEVLETPETEKSEFVFAITNVVSGTVADKGGDMEAGDDFTAEEITAENVPADDITADDITVHEVPTDNVTLDDSVGGIIADHVTSDPADDITADPADDITADDVTADNVTADDVTADHITANDVTADVITGVPVDDITVDDVIVDDVTVDEVPADDVVVDDITADDVTAADDIAADDGTAADDITAVDVDASDNGKEDIKHPLEATVTASPKIPAAEDVEKKTIEQVKTPKKQTDIAMVKLSDTSDCKKCAGTTSAVIDKGSKLLEMLLDQKAEEFLKTKEVSKETPKVASAERKESSAKTKKLEISQPSNVVNFVDLEESSSEDATPTDVQEVTKTPDDVVPETSDDVMTVDDDVTNVNIPSQIEIMSSGGNTSDIVTKEGEIVISGVPKPPPLKLARLNTGEVTIKTASSSESTLVIPEAKASDNNSKPKLSLEVFNLDSDDEESAPAKEPTPPPPEPPSTMHSRCINNLCSSESTVPFYAADPSTVAYYDANRKRRAVVCEPCAEAVAMRAQTLVEGIRNLTPLLQLDMSRLCEELVEISDSDSEGEAEDSGEVKEVIGAEGAKLLEEKLADMINETWHNFKMDARLAEAQDELAKELGRLEEEGKEIDAMFKECQTATDKLRTELYNTFEIKKQELPPIVIFDTPDNMFACTESAELGGEAEQTRQSKRRLSSASEAPPKRAAIPLGYAPLESEPVAPTQPAPTAEPEQDTKSAPTATSASAPPPSDSSKADDDKDISVVKLSAEAAPADLPPPGEMTRLPLRAGMQVYAMRNAFGSWLRAKVAECTPKGSSSQSAQFTQCRVKFESKTHKNAYKLLPARCLAYSEPSDVRMTIGTRLIALFKDASNAAKRESFYSGVVAEVPNPVNNYRYLVFFDDGYAQYVHHADTRLVCEFSPLVWEEVHPFSREFVREYLLAYPERPMVRLHTGQSLKTEWNGKWWVSRVIQVDASLVQVHFQEDNRTEWIYRGSTRLAPLYLELQAAERHRARPLPRNRIQNKVNMPYVEYTRSDEPSSTTKPHTLAPTQEEIRRQRAVAKKSTGASQPAPLMPPHAPHPQPPPIPLASLADTVTSRVVYYTPKNAVRPYKLTPHTCGPKCRRTDVLALQDLRTYNPLAKPLLSGWERQVVRYKGHKDVMYRAPCGRRLRNMRELHRYLRALRSDMGVDLFDFTPATHCLAEFVLNKCIIAKKDLSNGKENVPVPCVNYYDHSLPEFCSYNTERTPTEGVPLNLDPEFLCGCDCTDDCVDKSKCACWQMTLEGAKTIGLEGDVGYVYKRLPEPLPSGIYECNSRCKCKSTCLNRVAQHPLQLKLQVFKTLNRGWGIRALNDVPKGAFLCVYAGNLLTDATANLDGLNEGDEYLAELDYIEVVEQMKEGYEEDIPDADKKLDKKEGAEGDDSEEEMTSSSDDDQSSKNEKEDGDFQPGYIGPRLTAFSKRLRKRERAKRGQREEAGKEGGKEGKEGGEDSCITISDDEEVREPSRFTAQAGMSANEFISKYRSVRSYFGKDEACYIMDAKVQGNIGRYLNHSCSPNVFVQNVFVDTHDPRFPWVAFFALWPIRAGTELTWNYNYDIGSVPGKVLYCYCGAPNCRRRLL